MGILNVTPDSFSDGGASFLPHHAIEAGRAMVRDGADIIDIGGESTRPGAEPVSAAEEIRRVIPVIDGLREAGVLLSIDTRNAETMRAALAAGVHIINDVSALRHDPAAAAVVAGSHCLVVLMHSRGTPQTMQELAVYDDVTRTVAAELAAVVADAVAAGIARARIAVDPGFGFAKTGAQNITLLRELGHLQSLGLPILAGVSRKRFIAHLSPADPAARDPGSLAAGLFAVQQGARILRVHNVAATVQALKVWQALAA